MPNISKIAPATRLSWLNDYEHGMRIDTIAQNAKRTERTVGDQLERARREREQREIRGGLLRDAYREHFAELLGLAEEMRQGSRNESTIAFLNSASVRAKLLREALKSHTSKSKLWKARADQEKISKRIEEITKHAEAASDSKTRELLRIFPGLAVDGFSSSLAKAISEVADGRDASRRNYSQDSEWLTWGEFHLARDHENQVEVFDAHGRLIEEVVGPNSTLVPALKKARNDWVDTARIIEEEVEILLLRHYIPGQCNLCPVA